MKLDIALPVLLVFIPHAASDQTKLYHPRQVSYDALLNQESLPSESFVEALTQDGIISISNIPGYASHKNEALQYLHQCAITSNATREHDYSDGTTRLTMATHTVPGPNGQKVIEHNIPIDNNDEVAVCSSFSRSSDDFRRAVNKAILAFSTSLSALLDIESPLLSTKNKDYEFNDFASVVENGEHLEHFHSYQRKSIDTKSMDTIDMHTDQGLFIAFAPAHLVDVLSPSSASTSVTPSKGDFYIQTRDGLHHQVEFYPDDLVIMLGDGVNQYVNPKMKSSLRHLSLRATPHSLTMNQHDLNQARVWYGRMVLPPSDAIHPNGDTTFGELRRLMFKTSLSLEEDQEVIELGCSGSHQVARQLEESICDEYGYPGFYYCWNRCWNLTESGVSDEICAEDNLELNCINPEGEIWDGSKHDHSFYPSCHGELDSDSSSSSDDGNKCTGGTDCRSCKRECADNDGCGFESSGKCKSNCEIVHGACGDNYGCTGGNDCGSCKEECEDNGGCGFHSVGNCKGNCETVHGSCGGGGGGGNKCSGGNDCGSCKRECQDNDGCGEESIGKCKGGCEIFHGACGDNNGCTGGTDCGSCKRECQDNDGCGFKSVGNCKGHCETVHGPCGGSSSSSSSSDDGDKCSGGTDCGSCKRECADNDGCGFESVGRCKGNCEIVHGACGDNYGCTGGTDCGSCKKECQDNGGCGFHSVGNCKGNCETVHESCGGSGDGSSSDDGNKCSGGTDCGSCKRECQDNDGCGFESIGKCKGNCEEVHGPCGGASSSSDDGNQCSGGTDCGSCKRECEESGGCGLGCMCKCKGNCEQLHAPCDGDSGGGTMSTSCTDCSDSGSGSLRSREVNSTP